MLLKIIFLKRKPAVALGLLAKVLNLKCETDVLTRNVKVKNQATIKNRQRRQKNVANVFSVNTEEYIPKK